jgi:hypothetical protein
MQTGLTGFAGLRSKRQEWIQNPDLYRESARTPSGQRQLVFQLVYDIRGYCDTYRQPEQLFDCKTENTENDVMTTSKWRDLSPTEQQILDKLLSPEFPGKAKLAIQAKGCLATPLDDDGGIKLRPACSLPPALEIKSRVPTEGEFPDSDGIVVHVLLHVIDGFIDELEIYKEDGSEIRCLEAVRDMDVFAPG